MADWFIPPLALLVPSVRWYTGSSDVWLTFDDGPHPVATPAVLKVLREEKAKACFFLLGRHVGQHPTLVRRIRDEGHGVANHSFSHQPLWFRGKEAVARELMRTNDAIAAAGGGTPTLFRPPFGRFGPGTPRVARAAGMETVLFGVNSWDFAGGAAMTIVNRVVRRTRPGDILLFHDNIRTTEFIGSVVRDVIRRLRDRGMAIDGP